MVEPLLPMKLCRKGKIAQVANTRDCQASSGHLLGKVKSLPQREAAPRMHWTHPKLGLWLARM